MGHCGAPNLVCLSLALHASFHDQEIAVVTLPKIASPRFVIVIASAKQNTDTGLRHSLEDCSRIIELVSSNALLDNTHHGVV